MRSVVGPLLLGLFPLIAAGCTLPGRSQDRAESLGFGRRNAKPPRVSSELPSEMGSVRAPVKTGRLDQEEISSSQAHRQVAKESPLSDLDGEGSQPLPLNPGHSSDVARSLDNAPWPAATSGRSGPATDERISATAKSSDAKKIEKEKSKKPGDSIPSDVRQTGNRTDRDSSESPIQQQKLEEERSETRSRVSKSHQTDATHSVSDATKNAAGSINKVIDRSVSKVPLWPDRNTERKPNALTGAAGSKEKGTAGVRQISHPDSTPDQSNSVASGPLPALPWQMELEQLIARVERDLSQTAPDTHAEAKNEFLKKQAHLRLLYLMADRQEDAMTAIPAVDAFQQEFWQQMVWAMSNALDTDQYADPHERAAQTVPPLSAALRQMREQSALTIKNMTFCRKISYFGNYERFPRNDFTAGHEVLLYTEIENFVSSPTADGEYRTSLKSLIEITDSQGKIVWTKGFPSTEDFCRNPRRDYFHNYQFYIPEDLSTGAYTLKLTIVDELSKKRASNSLNFVLK